MPISQSYVATVLGMEVCLRHLCGGADFYESPLHRPHLLSHVSTFIREPPPL